MNIRDFYELAPLPKGRSFRDLLQGVSHVSTRVGFVVRPNEAHLSKAAVRLMGEAAPFLLSSDEAWTWPGSELMRSSPPYRHYVYRCEPGVLAVLTEASSSFGDWVSPKLPEDLHFLRSDNSVVLGSIGQEEFAWLELTGGELNQLSRLIPPGLQRSLRRRDREAD